MNVNGIKVNKRIKPRPYYAAEIVIIRSAVEGAVWPGLCKTLTRWHANR